VFHSVTVRGSAGSLLWYHLAAAEIGAWVISKVPGGPWMLAADLARTHPYYLEQRPLLFLAPRAGGFMTWPVATIDLVSSSTLRATLGPPVH
jgi:hypothetical protein